ncbi:MAG: hypothetical protein C4521_08485 [Actinobacteria bacterium]|nr:MAG: hypothetical protein C4521_08485 [Actinomycetota bacterium]
MNESMDKVFEVFAEAARVLEDAAIDNCVFGGVAVWGYGRRRPTKDIDFLVCGEDAERALAVLAKAGFEPERTDPTWIYKATKNGVTIDLIFEVAGGEVPCEAVIARRRTMTIEGVHLHVIAPEDLVAVKLAVIKARRPADWYDAVLVIKGTGGRLDWDYLALRSSSHLRRLLSLLLFAQSDCCPDEIPEEVIRRLARETRLCA